MSYIKHCCSVSFLFLDCSVQVCFLKEQTALPTLLGILLLMFADALFFDAIFGGDRLSPSILFVWTSIIFHLNNTCMWGHVQKNFWDVTTDNSLC